MLGMVLSSLDVAILERKILYKTAVLKGTEALLGLQELGKMTAMSGFLHWGTLIYRVNFAKACFDKWRPLASWPLAQQSQSPELPLLSPQALVLVDWTYVPQEMTWPAPCLSQYSFAVKRQQDHVNS